MSENQPRSGPGHGETDLDRLLVSMSAAVRSGEYVFVCLDAPVVEGSVATVHEDEGVTHVVPRVVADAHGWTYGFVAGWITLRVHSSLAAVGLTAAVSRVLAAAGISCNVLAGYHHDHLLVPANRVDEAVGLLQELSASRARPGAPG